MSDFLKDFLDCEFRLFYMNELVSIEKLFVKLDYLDGVAFLNKLIFF